MDKIEVTQNARQAAFDAYLTCYEIVPNDLWLQALLDGKHDGDEMAQTFARFERDILATRTDATPVAWMPDFNALEVAIGEGLILELDMDEDSQAEWIQAVSTAVARRVRDTNPPATDVAALVEALVAHNDALRSASQVAYRDGKDTNWLTFRGTITYTLAEHHDTVNAARMSCVLKKA